MSDNSSRKPVRGTVSSEDYDYLIRHLCGGEHGLQTEVISTLFTAFIHFVKAQNLEPYAANTNTPSRVRRLLRAVPELWSKSIISRSTDSKSD